MAEIDFKRKGTPLWLVLLILMVLGAGGYFLLGRRPEPAPQAVATDAPTATAAAATPAAAPLAPTAAFAKFANERRFPPTDAAAQRSFLSDASRQLSTVLQERAPDKGVQIALLRSVADTIAMAETKVERLPDLTQLAFFVFANAFSGNRAGSAPLNSFAARVQPNVAIGRQAQAIQGFVDAVREALTSPAAAAGAAGATGGPDSASATPRP